MITVHSGYFLHILLTVILFVFVTVIFVVWFLKDLESVIFTRDLNKFLYLRIENKILIKTPESLAQSFALVPVLLRTKLPWDNTNIVINKSRK